MAARLASLEALGAEGTEQCRRGNVDSWLVVVVF